MMRRPLTTLTLLVTCGVLALGAGLVAAIEASAGAAAKRSAAASIGRSWSVAMSAAANDLTLAEANFHQPKRGQRISGSSLQVRVGDPFGDDYLAAAALRLPTPGALRMLILLVNRPSPLEDPVSVSVRLTAPRALGAPLVLKSADPLSRAADARTPALCNLPLRGGVLGASEVRLLRSRGQALAGFDAASALAQAYGLVCGLPYASSFEQALGGSPVSPSPAPPESTPPVPSPTPPVGKLPGEGCVPTPGYACPAAFNGRRRAAFVEG